MRRVLDPGAVFAGWIGVGMSVLVAISFALIVAVQSLVFLFAPLGGLLIGYYANARSARRRPWWRLFANAGYAALVTGVSLALLYAGLRLLFVYADTGYPDFNLPGTPTCATGPDCTYQRYVKAGRAEELARLGVSDAAAFERYVLREQLNGAVSLIALTLSGAAVGAALHGLSGRREERAPAYPVA
jgi:hypothetical protein